MHGTRHVRYQAGQPDVNQLNELLNLKVTDTTSVQFECRKLEGNLPYNSAFVESGYVECTLSSNLINQLSAWLLSLLSCHLRCISRNSASWATLLYFAHFRMSCLYCSSWPALAISLLCRGGNLLIANVFRTGCHIYVYVTSRDLQSCLMQHPESPQTWLREHSL